MKTCFSLLGKEHRENPVFITGMGLQCTLWVEGQPVVIINCKRLLEFTTWDAAVTIQHPSISDKLKFYLLSLNPRSNKQSNHPSSVCTLHKVTTLWVEDFWNLELGLIVCLFVWSGVRTLWTSCFGGSCSNPSSVYTLQKVTTLWVEDQPVVIINRKRLLEFTTWFDCLFDLGFGLFGHLALEAHAVIPQVSTLYKRWLHYELKTNQSWS